MNSLKKFFLVLLIVSTCVSCDQTTKAMAQQYLASSPPIIYWDDLFRLQYSENIGAFLSLGSTWPPEIRYWLFTIFTSVILAGLFIFVLANRKLSLGTVLALALVIGGGFSNLIDRILFEGQVVDFMNIGLNTPWGSLRSGIFNVADMAITFGVIFLFLLSFQNEEASQDGRTGSVQSHPME